MPQVWQLARRLPIDGHDDCSDTRNRTQSAWRSLPDAVLPTFKTASSSGQHQNMISSCITSFAVGGSTVRI
jgi:hypothetical protein